MDNPKELSPELSLKPCPSFPSRTLPPSLVVSPDFDFEFTPSTCNGETHGSEEVPASVPITVQIGTPECEALDPRDHETTVSSPENPRTVLVTSQMGAGASENSTTLTATTNKATKLPPIYLTSDQRAHV